MEGGKVGRQHGIDAAATATEFQMTERERELVVQITREMLENPDDMANGASYAVPAILKIIRLAHQAEMANIAAPKLPERIMAFFCDAGQVEAVLGDMAEDHAFLVARQGRRTADLWYWRQVARSAWPLLWAALWRMVAVKELARRLWPW